MVTEEPYNNRETIRGRERKRDSFRRAHARRREVVRVNFKIYDVSEFPSVTTHKKGRARGGEEGCIRIIRDNYPKEIHVGEKVYAS